MITDAFHLVYDVKHRNEGVQVASHGLLGSNELDTLLLDFKSLLVYLQVVSDCLMRCLTLKATERYKPISTVTIMTNAVTDIMVVVILLKRVLQQILTG